MESIKIFRFETFRVGYIDKKLSYSSLFIIYMLKIVYCIESFAVEFAVIKHFGRESLHVEPSWGLDVVEYMLKCVFC